MIGEIHWLSFKTKRQRKKEEAEYLQFAFPYGDTQREKVMCLLRNCIPNMDDATLLVCHLTCKELYHDAFNGTNHAEALEITRKYVKKYRRFLNKKLAHIYLATALADLEIDENLNYPSPEQLLEDSKIYIPLLERK
jgi:hypothetical protein